MNYPIKYYQDTNQFPIYSLFPNPTTDEMTKTGMTNLPQETIQYGSCQKSTKPAPIGTGRPSSNKTSFDKTKTNLFPIGTFQTYNIQTKADQRFLTPSTLSMYSQIDSTFNQTRWICQPTSIGLQQFLTMTPEGIVPNQQKNNEEITCICNINRIHDKNKTVWTPLPVDRLPKLTNCHGQRQSLTRNLESQNVNQVAVQGFNNYTNQNLQIPQTFRGAYHALTTPMPNPAVHGFLRQAKDNYPYTIANLPGQAIHGVPSQSFVVMERQDGAAKKSGDNHNGNSQTMSSKGLIPGPHCSREPERGTDTKYSAHNKARSFVVYNTNYGRRSNNKRNKFTERH